MGRRDPRFAAAPLENFSIPCCSIGRGVVDERKGGVSNEYSSFGRVGALYLFHTRMAHTGTASNLAWRDTDNYVIVGSCLPTFTASAFLYSPSVEKNTPFTTSCALWFSKCKIFVPDGPAGCTCGSGSSCWWPILNDLPTTFQLSLACRNNGSWSPKVSTWVSLQGCNWHLLQCIWRPGNRQIILWTQATKPPTITANRQLFAGKS